MRELLISDKDKKLPLFNNKNKQQSNVAITELLNTSAGCFSLELCPNRNLDTQLLSTLNTRSCSIPWFLPHAPGFKIIVEEIPALKLADQLHSQGYNVTLHFAARNLNESIVLDILKHAKHIGVRNILALQGDPSQTLTQNEKCRFPYAADLVQFIKTKFGNQFCIGVAGYPEKHPLSPTVAEDIKWLKHKVSFGADFIITQGSYNYESYENYSKICKNSSIKIPVIPGVFVFGSYKTLSSISKFCAVDIPQDILKVIDKNKGNEAAIREFGIYYSVELIKKLLLKNGDLFHGVHIFTLNDLTLIKEVFRRLGFYKTSIQRLLR